jgi:hypothetical protein
MQVPPTAAAAPTAGVAPPTLLRVTAGQLATVPVGELLQAVVTAATPREATVTVNGTALTVRPAAGLQPGTVLAVRVPSPAALGLEVLGKLAGSPAKVTGGSTDALPRGAVLAATVVEAGTKQAVLAVGGARVTVETPVPLPAGASVPVRVPADGGRTLELFPPPAAAGRAAGVSPPVTASPRDAIPNRGSDAPRSPVQTVDVSARPTPGRVNVPTQATRPDGATAPLADRPATGAGVRAAAGTGTPTRPAGAAAPPPAVTPRSPVQTVDVVAARPDGRLAVRIDGRAAVAASEQPLQPGGRYVLQVDRTAGTLVLRPPLDGPELPQQVATAILRGPKPPGLGESVRPLAAELAAVPDTPEARPAVAEVREALKAVVPEPGRPPSAKELKALVEDGGLAYEAKLARAADGGPDPTRTPDLKGGLLRLLKAVPAAADAAPPLPAARAALDGIEARQAANALAQPDGGPYLLQVPFPDGDRLRTLDLMFEPDREADPEHPQPSAGYRLLMHVELTDLGDTWIDAGTAGGAVRAVVYLDSAAARDRVRGGLSDLRAELSGLGFREVLLDVRSAADLPAGRRARALRAGRTEGVTVVDARA